MKKKLHFKKNAYMVIMIMVVVLLSMAGFVYAFWTLFYQDRKKQCLLVTYQANTSEVLLSNLSPISDSTSVSPITFMVENVCKDKINYTVNLETKGQSVVKEDSIEVSLNGSEEKKLSTFPAQKVVYDNDLSNHILISNSLEAGEKSSYDLKLWMGSDVVDPLEVNQNYLGEIMVLRSNIK